MTRAYDDQILTKWGIPKWIYLNEFQPDETGMILADTSLNLWRVPYYLFAIEAADITSPKLPTQRILPMVVCAKTEKSGSRTTLIIANDQPDPGRVFKFNRDNEPIEYDKWIGG